MPHIELIAEISTNHGGDMDLAKEFIHRYAEAGADWVKFQHTRVKHLRPDDPQYAWFQRAEFSVEQFAELKAECEKAGTKFLTTVFNAQDVPEVASLGLEAIKIGSGEAGDNALAKAIVELCWPDRWPRLLVSCGLASPLNNAFYGLNDVQWLRCVARYPCHESSAAWAYDGIYHGWSDHAIGLGACRLAIENGAKIIEKHASLPNQARPIRSWEATVEEFKALRAFADDDPSRHIGRWQYA